MFFEVKKTFFKSKKMFFGTKKMFFDFIGVNFKTKNTFFETKKMFFNIKKTFFGIKNGKRGIPGNSSRNIRKIRGNKMSMDSTKTQLNIIISEIGSCLTKNLIPLCAHNLKTKRLIHLEGAGHHKAISLPIRVII